MILFRLVKKILKKNYKILISFFFRFIYVYPKLPLKKNDLVGVIKKKIKLNKKNYFANKIIDGRLYTDNVYFASYISKNNFLIDTSYQFANKKNSLTSYNQNISRNPTLTNGTPKFIVEKKFNILSLLSGGAAKENFSHWFLDVIPKIYLFKRLFKNEKIDKIIVPSTKLSFQKESLMMLGFKSKDIMSANQLKHIKCKNLFTTSHPSNYHPEGVPLWNIKYIRSVFLNNKKKSNINYERIYIDRSQSHLIDTNNLDQFKTFRVILNEDEIKKYLISYGFKIVKPEKYSFRDQISLYNNAKVIFSLFGAAMYLISLCKPKTKIIEIRPKKASDEFKKIAKFCNLNHNQINLSPIVNPGKFTQQGLLYCSLSRVEKVIKNLSLKKIN